MGNGLKELHIQLDRIVEKAGKAEYVREAGDFVRSAAVLKATGLSGYLRQNIFHDFEQGRFSATSEIYTNVSYAPYVEFGTGPKGAEKHDGISPEANPVYRMTPWWIPESEVDPWIAEQYHWPSMDTPDGKLYRCDGQPARPFMYPALKNNQDDVVQIMKEGLNSILKGTK